MAALSDARCLYIKEGTPHTWKQCLRTGKRIQHQSMYHGTRISKLDSLPPHLLNERRRVWRPYNYSDVSIHFSIEELFPTDRSFDDLAVRVTQLIRAYQVRGHYAANLGLYQCLFEFLFLTCHRPTKFI